MRFFFFSPFFPTFICKSILYRILMHRCAVNTVQRAHTIRFDAVFFFFFISLSCVIRFASLKRRFIIMLLFFFYSAVLLRFSLYKKRSLCEITMNEKKNGGVDKYLDRIAVLRLTEDTIYVSYDFFVAAWHFKCSAKSVYFFDIVVVHYHYYYHYYYYESLLFCRFFR